MTEDDLSNWSAVGTPAVTGSIDDPTGGTGAYTVEDNDGAALEYPWRNITFTGNASKAFVFVVRERTMSSAGVQQLAVWDDTAAVTRLGLSISAWTSGAPTVAATVGTYLGRRYVGSGYWAIYGIATGVIAANTNRVFLRPASTASATGSIDVWRVNTWNLEYPPNCILDASGTKGAEVLYRPWPHTARPMTVYASLRYNGAAHDSSGPRIMHIGNDFNAPYFSLLGGSGVYRILQHDGDGQDFATVTVTPDFDQGVELLGKIGYNESGFLSLDYALDGGNPAGEQVSDGGPLVSFTNPFSLGRVYVGSAGADRYCPDRILKIRVSDGDYTMAEARTLTAARLHARTA